MCWVLLLTTVSTIKPHTFPPVSLCRISLSHIYVFDVKESGDFKLISFRFSSNRTAPVQDRNMCEGSDRKLMLIIAHLY